MFWFLSVKFQNAKVQIVQMYDLLHVRLKFAAFLYMKCKLANIIIPPDMKSIEYNNALDYVRKYIYKKKFDVRWSDDEVHLYQNDTYLNNFINNVILFHISEK